MTSLPARVSIYEVSPRDGLQNEAAIVPVGQKGLLIQALVGAGLRRIEVTSYVSPRWIPQLADADELTKDIARPGGVRFSALCPNSHGLERAVNAGMQEIAIFLSASETHNQKNTNRSIERSLWVFEELVPLAITSDLKVRAYISTVWGCPYEGAVDEGRVLEIAQALIRFGCYQVSLGDTIGVGTPNQTARIVELFLRHLQPDQVALHMHDTRGTALANALVGLQHGITHFDASVAGLGGCPYAPGAAGNLATEDLVYMLEGMGIETGINLPALVEAGRVAERIVGRPLPGKVHQAGVPTLRR
ncbi:MAG TPA: hydroxymethylglutaryl-CoA lyase [Polyangiaceae bacterium]|jgi:hydroxymethylglutaryl-CoA lyase|nr:hydroxymethylglutaryl-CoA lyase [Polyangiaceae bacterium]